MRKRCMEIQEHGNPIEDSPKWGNKIIEGKGQVFVCGVELHFYKIMICHVGFISVGSVNYLVSVHSHGAVTHVNLSVCLSLSPFSLVPSPDG